MSKESQRAEQLRAHIKQNAFAKKVIKVLASHRKQETFDLTRFKSKLEANRIKYEESEYIDFWYFLQELGLGQVGDKRGPHDHHRFESTTDLVSLAQSLISTKRGFEVDTPAEAAPPSNPDTVAIMIPVRRGFVAQIQLPVNRSNADIDALISGLEALKSDS